MAPKRKAETQLSFWDQSKRIKTDRSCDISRKKGSLPEATSSKTPASFFTLPAELRNHIYELALVEKDNIKVSKDLKPPGLLSVNRQTGSESRQIWYYKNAFAVEIFDCAPGLLEPFLKWIQPIRTPQGKQVAVYTESIKTAANWNNLMEMVSRCSIATDFSGGRRTGLTNTSISSLRHMRLRGPITRKARGRGVGGLWGCCGRWPGGLIRSGLRIERRGVERRGCAWWS